MASESSPTDRRVDEHTEENKVSTDTKLEGEEINFQHKDISGKDEVNNVKEEGSTVTSPTASVAEVKQELEDISAVEEVKEEPIVFEYKTEELKHAEAPSTSENEHTALEEAPLASIGLEICKDENVGVDTQEKVIPESSKDKKVEVLDLKASEDLVQEPIVPDVSETPEQVNFGRTLCTSIEVPVKDMEAEYDSPEEQEQDVVEVVVPDVSDSPDNNEDNLKGPATIEVPSLPEREKQEKIIESNEPISNVIIADGGARIAKSSLPDEKVSGDTSAVDKSGASLEVEQTETPVETKEDVDAKTKTAYTPSDEDSAYKRVVVDNKNESLEGEAEASTGGVPIKDLFVEADFPEEEKQDKVIETQELSSNVAIADDGAWIAGSSLHGTCSGDALVVQKIEESLEVEPTEIPAVTKGDFNAKTEATHTPSDEDKTYGVVVEKNESLQGGMEASTEMPIKDLEVEAGLPEEDKQEKIIETQESSSNVPISDGGAGIAESSLDDNASGDALSVENSEESLEVEQAQTPVETKEDVNAKAEATPAAFDEDKTFVVEKNESLQNGMEASTEVPIKDLEVEADLPEVKQETIIETQEPSSYVTIADGGAGIAESSLHDEKASRDALTVEISEESLDVDTTETDLERKEDVNSKAEATLTPSDDGKTYDVVVVEKKNESLGGRMEASTEVPLRDLEVDAGLPEEEKQEKIIDTQEPSSNVTLADAGAGIAESSLHEKTSRDALPDEKSEESLEMEPTETPVETKEDVNAKAEATHTASDEDKTYGVVVEKKNESLQDGMEASTEVPVKGLEVEASSPEEEKQEKITEIQETSSKMTIADGGAGVVESSLHDEEASGDALPVEKSEESLEVDTTETALETKEDVNAKAEAIHTPSDEDKTYEVVVDKKNESLQGGMEASTDLDASLLSELSPEPEKTPNPKEKVEKEDAIESYGSSAASKDTEHRSEGGTALGVKVVDNEKEDNIEDLKTDLAETFTEIKESGVYSEQVKPHETVEGEQKVLEVNSKNLNFALKASEVTSAGGQVFPGNDSKREELKEQDATLLEAPKSFTIVNEPSAQVIKEKNESSKGEREAPSGASKGMSLAEAFAEEEKDVAAKKTVQEKKHHEASREISLKEKPTMDAAKGIEASESVEDKEKPSTEAAKDIEAPGMVKEEHEALGVKKEESEKSKHQDCILSSDTGNAKLVKEVSKREPSSIFTKMKRSLVKAKKAILGKSPSPKTTIS